MCTLSLKHYCWVSEQKTVLAKQPCYIQSYIEQEAHGPQLAHLSETATADMQMACNIFPVLSNIETYHKAMA